MALPDVRFRLMVVLGLLTPGAAFPGQLVCASGPAQVALVELFTSEGCSSCPPAEQWLADRRTDPGLWHAFVPVAWHVIYWDGLGWADRWAQRAFADRQYAYASAWHGESVYTPCFVRNGREWRPGRADVPERSGGTLAVRYDPQTGALDATFRPANPTPGLVFELYAVQLGGGLRSQVKAGENAGRVLATRVRGAGRRASRVRGPGGDLPRHADFSNSSRPRYSAPGPGGVGDAPRGAHAPAGDGWLAGALSKPLCHLSTIS